MVKFFYWLPSLIWMGVIFYLSSRTGDDLESLFPFLESFDWGHLVAYYILCLLVYFALNKTFKPKRNFLWSIILSVLYGITDEFHQSFVPSRYPDVFDLMNDFIGAGFAMVTLYFFKKRMNFQK